VRALADAGWSVGVAVGSRRSVVALSRHARRRHVVGEPEADVDAFVERVRDCVAAGGYEVVFTSSDADALVLSQARERIGARCCLPPDAAVRRGLDKVELARAAGRAGVRTPATARSGAEAVTAFPGRRTIVKERVHGRAREHGRLAQLSPVISADAAAIDRAAERVRAAGGEPVIQEHVAGDLLAFCSVRALDGRLVARVQQVAERVWPRDRGLSVRARTVPVDEALAERAGALLGELGWHGLSQLQFLAGDGGEPCLIDFNGRFYGSLALGRAAGVNLPAAWAAVLTARPLDGLGGDAAPGVRYQWLEGDLSAALDDGERPLRALRRSLRYACGARQSVWDPADPLPAVVSLGSLVRRAARRTLATPRA